MRIGKFAKLTAVAGALTLVLSTSDAIARTGAGGGGRGGVVAARPMVRPIAPHAFRNHNHRGFFPGAGGFYYAPDGTPVTDMTPPPSNTSQDIRYTYTYDVPWDWAHRFPPNVVPSDRPYVSSCTNEPVIVPGSRGGEQTVNVTRCY